MHLASTSHVLQADPAFKNQQTWTSERPVNFATAHDESGHLLEEDVNTPTHGAADPWLLNQEPTGPILAPLLPFHAVEGKLSLGKMVAGNGLSLPQRQFIQFASYPPLRSEERLGKRAAGSWPNTALEGNGRLLSNHSFSLRGTACRQETGSCAVQTINSEEYAPTKCWSHHKLLRAYAQETQSFRRCLNACSLSQNHRMVWVGRDLTDHLVPTSLPWAGTPSTGPDCSKPCPTWP